jgi:ABC-2 type transport system ATP-binding protein
VYGFLGPNGAGKTTTLRMLMGLVRPSGGSARLLDGSPGDPAVLRRAGALIEGPGFYPYLSGRDNLRVLARYNRIHDREVEAALEQVELRERAGDRFRSYSLGMKQRLGVAAALLGDPDLLILDEPTNGLDPAGIRDIRDMIRGLGESGVTVLLSSHILAEVQQVCHSVSIIGNGRLLAFGNVDDLVGAGAASTTRVRVADQPTAATHLERAGFTVATNGDGALHVEGAAQPEQITRVLAEQGMYVSELTPVRRDLESVFLQLTKDNTIAATVGAE